MALLRIAPANWHGGLVLNSFERALEPAKLCWLPVAQQRGYHPDPIIWYKAYPNGPSVFSVFTYQRSAVTVHLN